MLSRKIGFVPHSSRRRPLIAQIAPPLPRRPLMPGPKLASFLIILGSASLYRAKSRRPCAGDSHA